MEEIIANKEVLSKLLSGIDKLANTVKVTLGPSGNTVIIADEYGKPYATKDGVSVSNYINLKDPVENIGATMVKEVAEKTAEEAGDGPQPLYSKVLTPKGWVNMEKLKVGTIICGTNKTTQKVIGVFPKGNLEIYKLTFSDGRVVECSKNHLWNVTTNYGKQKLLTTEELLKSNKVKVIKDKGYNEYGFYINNNIVEFTDNSNDLILDPFLVGLLIGDGSLCKSGSIELSLAMDQEYVLDRIVLPENIKYTCTKVIHKNYLRVKFSRKESSGKTMHDYIKEIGLLNTKSKTKFIPKEYLYTSYKNRKALLDGLTETDGHINKRGLLEYSTVSTMLCNDVIELLRGLGKTTHTYLKKRTGDSYSNTSIHTISELQGYKYGIKLINIEPTGIFTDMMCIKVSNDDSLYVTNDYIVTHNTTTATVLAQALITNGIKFLNNGGTYNEIKDIYSTLLPKILKKIKESSRTVTTNNVVDVATISANNDSKIGELIQVAFNHSTVVKVEEGKDIKDSLELITGVTYPVTYFSKKFITNEAKNIAEVNDAVVLLLGCKLDKLDNLKKVLTYCNKEEKPLLIITEFISDDALHILETNHINNAVKILPIKTPGYATYRNEYIKDISELTDSTIIDDLTKMVEINNLGKIKSVTSKPSESILIPHDDIDISDRITNLFTLSKEPELGKYDKKVLLERIDNLNGKVSIIKVGAKSEIEMKERYDRIEDAVYAVSSALEEGVLEGGGVALYKIADSLDVDSSKSLYLILQALRAPNKTINENGAKVNPFVFDDYTVVDPAKVTRCALENAASVALTILGTKAVVLNEHLW